MFSVLFLLFSWRQYCLQHKFCCCVKIAQLNSCKDLLKNPDKAFFAAKERGRNKVATDE